jgi:hypothetical protein
LLIQWCGAEAVKGRNILMEPEREATLTYVQRVSVQIKKNQNVMMSNFKELKISALNLQL